MQGIYTLANDTVYDQLVALLNSIEANINSKIPVCVIPYNTQLDRVKQEIASRKNVFLYDNWSCIRQWDDFAHKFWAAHPAAKQSALKRPGWYKGCVHRKFAAFEGPFDQFVFYDADSLAMKPIDDIFERLQQYDLIFNDWEHAKPRPVTQVNLEEYEQATGATEAEIRPKLHCDSFFGSKKDLYNAQALGILEQRVHEGTWIRNNSWWSSSALFNYITLAIEYPLFNFTLSPNCQERTGNCANADPFVAINNVLYNEDGLKPLHRIHYMSYPAADFTRLSHGEDVNIRYKDIFLHYRYLKNPEQKPQMLQHPSLPVQINRKVQKAVRKVQRVFA